MPPRLAVHIPRLFRAPGTCVHAPRITPSLFLPILRSASILSDLRDVRGAYNKRKRLGRGPGSGKGKTSGRGHKGQKQHGKVPRGFNGGQTPDEVVRGPRGFVNVFSVEMSPLNVDRVQEWIDQGRLDPSRPITIRELTKSRCLHGIKDGVKLLARNKEKLKTSINIVVSQASASAISAVEAAGGTITTRYYSKAALNNVRRGLSHPFLSLLSKTEDSSWQNYKYRLPDPAGRKDIEYYRDPAHRGYLSWQLQDGQSPSLFWRTPGFAIAQEEGMKRSRREKGGQQEKAQNLLW